MSTVTYIYDGTLDGFLTAVALAIKDCREIHGVFRKKDYVSTLFDSVEQISASSQQAKRLLDYLSHLDPQAGRLAINGYLSEDREAGLHLYHFIRLSLQHGKSVVSFHGNDSVRLLNELSRKVSFEAHRLNGFIRFRILADGLQYGPLAPDHNVIGFCATHFRGRLSSRRWILHDLRRKIGLYWDTRELQQVAIEDGFTSYVVQHGELPTAELTEDECYYQGLWRGFYRAINNSGRENRQLQRQFMPRRYWKYLIESPD